MKYILVFIILAAAAGGGTAYWLFTDKPSNQMTEAFIQRWLTNANGTLATYIQGGVVEDEDEVKGREALSETLGLWMTYAYENKDEALFEQSYRMLHRSFLAEDGFVYWKLKENGTTEVGANALIDDIRLAGVLIKAGGFWENEDYQRTGRRILDFVEKRNVKNGILTDFYERKQKLASETITLSYIDADLLLYLEEKDVLDAGIGAATREVLKQAPVKSGFYPKAYDVVNKQYQYDEQVNMVDQALAALHQAEAGMVSPDFLQFVASEMENRQLIYGVYEAGTKKPLVAYESPAIYALLVMYCLELGETDLARRLHEKMNSFRVERRWSKYYGGYSVHGGDTHIFDNLLPLLAERRMKMQ